MPTLQKGDVRIRYEEAGSGFPLLVTPGGGLNSRVSNWPTAVELVGSIEPDSAVRRGPVFRFGNPHVACACPRWTNRRYAGQPVRSVKRTLATAIRAAGLDALPDGHLRFHDLRHAFASWALAEGGDLKLVQEALGHKHITTTARYAHLLTGRREAVVGAVAEKLTGSAGVAMPKKTIA